MRYQELLDEVGVTDKELHKWLVAQLIQENGAISPDRIHKNGYVFGIFQYNVRAHTKYKWAKDFLADHPEWRDADFQLRYMTNMVVERSKMYNGNISCIILHNFHPYSTEKSPHGADWFYETNQDCSGHKYVKVDVSQRLSLLVLQ